MTITTVRPWNMDRRVTIQKRTTTTNAYGHEENRWSDVATVWASVRPIGAREKLRADAIGAEVSHTIAIHWQAKLMPPADTAAMRVSYGERIFNITGARDINEARRVIVLDCVEGSADGQ